MTPCGRIVEAEHEESVVNPLLERIAIDPEVCPNTVGGAGECPPA
jgi:hypothetical protein